MPKVSFEDSIDLINNEINKRKRKWSLRFLTWLDFDDVAQVIRIHIYKKWYQYDDSKPLAPWLNRIISNQMKNLIRNVYGNYSRPCLRCAAYEGDLGCRIYKSDLCDCPIYARWTKTKKSAHDIKLALSLDLNQGDIQSIPVSSPLDNVEKVAEIIHEKMKGLLKPLEWKVYKFLYIEHKSEEETARLMGYKTTERNRPPGYKQLKNIKKVIMIKVNKLVRKGDVDLY